MNDLDGARGILNGSIISIGIWGAILLTIVLALF
jgi:hypothetical protein